MIYYFSPKVSLKYIPFFCWDIKSQEQATQTFWNNVGKCCWASSLYVGSLTSLKAYATRFCIVIDIPEKKSKG